MTLDTTIGGASADSYATLADYQTYASAMGWTLSGADATDEQNMRRAAMFLDRGNVWIGYRASETQARDWPRITTVLVDGWSVPSDTIPQAIKDAQCEAAYLIQGGLDPFATVTGGAVKRAVAGPTEVEYVGGGRETPRLVAIEGLIGPYLGVNAGQVRLQRA